MLVYKKDNKTILADKTLDEDFVLDVVEKIECGDYELLEVLKDDTRSKVLRIRFNRSIFVLKFPVEKNQRPWIRLLTLVRQGEAFKNLLGMQLLISKGIKTTVPYLACEYRKSGMVYDSWLLYYYLEGKVCLDRPETYKTVAQLLKEMHKKNILHGDPQIRNFVTSSDELHVIDANPKYSRSLYAKAYEFAYLRKSQPEIEAFFGSMATSLFYKAAVRLDRLDRKIARLRRTVKGLLGLKS